MLQRCQKIAELAAQVGAKSDVANRVLGPSPLDGAGNRVDAALSGTLVGSMHEVLDAAQASLEHASNQLDRLNHAAS